MNIFNLSFGKDSMATLILAYEQGIPIDRVMYCDIRFSPEISGEHPVMAKWIPTAEKRLKELFGIDVDHAYSGVSFIEQFFCEESCRSACRRLLWFSVYSWRLVQRQA